MPLNWEKLFMREKLKAQNTKGGFAYYEEGYSVGSSAVGFVFGSVRGLR
jgi:hypothetical protein